MVKEGRLRRTTLYALLHHVIQKRVVFPGVGYVELAIAEGVAMELPGGAALLRDMTFIQMWVLEPNLISWTQVCKSTVRLSLEFSGRFQISSACMRDPGSWDFTVRACGLGTKAGNNLSLMGDKNSKLKFYAECTKKHES